MRADSDGTGHQLAPTDVMVVTADKMTPAGTLSGVVNMIETIKPLIRILLLAGILLVPLAVLGQVSDLDRGLVAYYPFNGNANDESGNGHDGTVNGVTLGEDRFGRSDSAYVFNERFDWIDVPDFQFNSITVNLVYTYQGIGDWTALLGRDGGSFVHLLINPQHELGFYKNNFFSSGYKMIVGKIYVITLVKNDTNCKIYIDGNQISSRGDSFSNSSYPLSLIGNEGGSKGWGSNGTLDDVRIYNRALSEEEVLALYKKEPSTYRGIKISKDLEDQVVEVGKTATFEVKAYRAGLEY